MSDDDWQEIAEQSDRELVRALQEVVDWKRKAELQAADAESWQRQAVLDVARYAEEKALRLEAEAERDHHRDRVTQLETEAGDRDRNIRAYYREGLDQIAAAAGQEPIELDGAYIDAIVTRVRRLDAQCAEETVKRLAAETDLADLRQRIEDSARQVLQVAGPDSDEPAVQRLRELIGDDDHG